MKGRLRGGGVPVAVVEKVTGKVVGVEFMDYVTPGKVVKLGPQGSIVLEYMTSCWRETITGGTVVVGSGEACSILVRLRASRLTAIASASQ